MCITEWGGGEGGTENGKVKLAMLGKDACKWDGEAVEEARQERFKDFRF